MSEPPALSDQDLQAIYRAMLLVRLVDQRMLLMQRQGRIGFYGSASGQEASVIASAYALAPEDWVFPSLREGGVALLRGFSLRHYIAQILGNSADIQKGRQMPSHYSDRSVNHVNWSSCIATQLPHAVGAAWAAQILRDPRVVMAYLGDGATSEGDFHVAMNFAGVFRVPVVFFCQNNQWAISVGIEQQTRSESIAIKAVAYGFEGVRVDGNDALAVYQATRAAVDRARSGQGPTLIEAVTYRMGAHSTSDDPSRYRDESITETWKARDPIARLRAYLEQSGRWDAAREQALTTELEGLILATIAEVESLPPPARATLFEDVYAEKTWSLREQEEESTIADCGLQTEPPTA